MNTLFQLSLANFLLFMQLFLKILIDIANSVDPNQEQSANSVDPDQVPHFVASDLASDCATEAGYS